MEKRNLVRGVAVALILTFAVPMQAMANTRLAPAGAANGIFLAEGEVLSPQEMQQYRQQEKTATEVGVSEQRGGDGKTMTANAIGAGWVIMTVVLLGFAIAALSSGG